MNETSSNVPTEDAGADGPSNEGAEQESSEDAAAADTGTNDGPDDEDTKGHAFYRSNASIKHHIQPLS